MKNTAHCILLCILLSLMAKNIAANCLYERLKFRLFCTNLHEDVLFLPQNRNAIYVKQIVVENSTVTYLDKNSLSTYRNITAISMKNVGLRNVSADALNNSTLLTNLDLSLNLLLKISNKTFNNLERLTYLNLSRNVLKYMEKSTFKDMVSLQVLDLSHNLQEKLDASLFKDLINLKHLNVSDNALRYIDIITFSNLENLQSLDLSHNLLKKIQLGTLYGLIRLQTLNLGYNQLRFLSIVELYNIRYLRELHVESNNLTDLENSIKMLPYLRTLSIRNNPLSCFSLENIIKHTVFKAIYLNEGRVFNKTNLFGTNCKINSIYLENFENDLAVSLIPQSEKLTTLMETQSEINGKLEKILENESKILEALLLVVKKLPN